MKKKNGFTLIELLVVIIILGILAAIAVPKYMIARDRAKATEAIQQMSVIAKDAKAYFDMTGAWPTNLGTLGYKDNFVGIW